MKKKVATWHKKTSTTKQTKQAKATNGSHWIQSRARLTKILEASGMMPEKTKHMITCDRDR